MKALYAAALVIAFALPAHAAPGEGMMGHRMPGPGMMAGPGMGGERLCHIVGSGHHLDGTLAFLKAELKISAAQQSSWDAFALAYRNTVPADTEGDEDDHDHADDQHRHGPGMKDMQSLPDRMDMHEKMMEGRLVSMKKIHVAVSALYASLNADQKKLADDLVPPFMMCRMHM